MSLEVNIKKRLGNFMLDVSFSAGDEVIGLIGASGCGKSVTLKCIAGVITPDEGRIILNDRVLFDSAKGINIVPEKRRVGLLFQNYGLFPNMTVYENIRTGTLRDRMSRNIRNERIEEMINKFHLNGLEKQKPAQLSGGQQQRTALARILISEPEILMLDEPFSALDSYLRWEMESELAQVLDSFNKTTLFVSHNKNEVLRLCDRACVISEGKSGKLKQAELLFSKPETVSEAVIAGCKNISLAKKYSDNEVFAKDWGFVLKAAAKVPEDIAAVGIHSTKIVPHSMISDDFSGTMVRCKIMRRCDGGRYTIYVLKPMNQEGENTRTLIDNVRIRMDIESDKEKIMGEFVDVCFLSDGLMMFCH